MKTYSLLLFTFFMWACSPYDGAEESLDYDRIEITFQGYGTYQTEGDLKIVVTDSTDVQKLNVLKNNSEGVLFGSVKGTEFVIELVYVDSESSRKLLLKILKSGRVEPTVMNGPGNWFDGIYENHELVSYVSALIKLEEIQRYNGALSQEEYDAFD